MTDKLTETRRIKRMEATRDDKRLAIFERRKAIRAEVDGMLDEVAASLESKPQVNELFTIRWEIAG